MAENKNNILSKLPFAIPAVHCIGIGGIGVSAIAELLLDCGCKVSGSDMELNSNCAHLSKLGAVIAPAGHRAENVPDHPLGGGIMTAAADMTNPEVQALLLKKALVWRRGEFLGELCKAYKRPVMVAGSHGKSSVSAMLGWIFKQCSIETALLLGAHYQDHSRNACAGNGDILIAEADESDNSIKYLSGELALITNIDGDHAWDAKALDAQYKAFLSFGKAFKKVICVDSENCRNVLNGLKNVEALDSKRIAELGAMVPERFVGYERINAALALAGAEYLQISLADAAGALASYPGLQRRQSELLRSRKFVLLEDYAHHPAELAASLEVIKKRYPGYQITLLFQPHRYQRLQHYF